MRERYLYMALQHFSVLRSGTMSYQSIPVDGSLKMDDALMDSLEPFDMSEAVDFQTAYLSGFFADRYDVSAAQSIGRAQGRIRATTESLLKGTATGYATLTAERQRPSIR